MRRLYATRSTPRSAPRLRSVVGRLDPPLGRDQEVALREWRAARRCASRDRSACEPRQGVGGTCHPRAMRVADLPTPALVVDAGALAHNLDTMTAALPGARLRPHVKAHKCTALAQEQAARGHHGFTCATPREVVGMARAGLGDDLLLANQTVDADRLRAMADTRRARHGRGRLGRDDRRRRATTGSARCSST